MLSNFWILFIFDLTPWLFASDVGKKSFCTFVDEVIEYDDGNRMCELFCKYGLPQSYIDSNDTVSSLLLQDSLDENFDAEEIVKNFPKLRKLSIINGNLQRIISPFSKDASLLEMVEIRDTSLSSMVERTFTDLPMLRLLDLRNNALVRLNPDDLIALATLRNIYLAGNHWSCDENSAWLVNNSYASLVERIEDKDEIRCWSPFKGKPLLFVTDVMQRLQNECRQLVVCECELVYVVNSVASLVAAPGGNNNNNNNNNNPAVVLQQQQTPPRQQRQFMAFASVNCSYRGFTDMPDFLPANTTTLHLEGNKISNLTPLKTNPVYKSVVDLYMDNNEIESIGLLDGTYWLEHFRLLSLRGNKMTDFSTYALENVLPHSQTAVSLYLGNNPWRCDCQITPGFQEFLIKYGYLIKDVREVRCSSDNGDYVDRQILELTRTEICVPPAGMEIYPLDVINVCMALMILWILIKLIYDYYIFKNTGKLPWLARMLP